MNINWKSRLTNKTFWVAIVSAVVLLTQQLGINIFPSNWSRYIKYCVNYICYIRSCRGY